MRHIFWAGDSTVACNKYNTYPQTGIAQAFDRYTKEDVVIVNHAVNGRSTKSFIDESRLAAIYNDITEGDYLFVQFAINDSASSIAERYAPVCGNVDNPASGSYEWYMTQFIQGAKNKGATPVLVTTTLSAKNYTNGKFTNSYTAYCDACKKLAKKIISSVLI